LAGVLMAPVFLVYSQQLEKADCVIMLVGGEPGARIKGAKQLAEQSQVSSLLIPAYNQVAFVEGDGLSEVGHFDIASVVARPVKFLGRSYRVFENTHLELLKGKKIMDKLGYRSAIIVSSPYHMRRLQLIAWKVFGDEYEIGFQPTPFEKFDTLSCFQSWEMFENVGSEYLKISWFLVYSWFV